MKRLILASIISLISFSFASPTLAFNPNNIISDWDLTDPFALDFNQIQQFMKRGFLDEYVTTDWQGDVRYAADIVSRAAQNYNISPKFLLVLLQKEQSLIEDDDPSQDQLDWATGYAICDNCSKDDPTLARWKGFGKQVNSAAMQFSEGYMTDIETAGSTQGKYGPGIPVQIDDTVVVPENAATAALYAYTPHLSGNENFANIWDRWFSFQHPTGTLLKAKNSPDVYLIEYGYKRHITNWSAFISRFNPSLIIETSENTLNNYAEGRPIDFPNYSLLQDENNKIYLLVDDTLRQFDSIETFHSIGFVDDEIMPINNDDLVLFDLGQPITSTSVEPQGKLLQLATTGAVFYIQDGVRHQIIDKAILKSRFANWPLYPAQSVEIEQYKEGSQVTLPDGYLVKSSDDPTVYIISEGERRPIASESAFLSYGYSWNDILTIDPTVINAHPLGPSIDSVSTMASQ